jgi:hypothetical protein
MTITKDERKNPQGIRLLARGSVRTAASKERLREFIQIGNVERGAWGGLTGFVPTGV